MTELYLGMAALLALAILILLLAGRRRGAAQDSGQHLYAQQRFFRQRLQELHTERDNGQLDDAQLAELERELKRQLVSETDQRPDYNDAAVAKGRYWVYLLVVLLPLLAVAIYLQLGYQADMKLRAMQRDIASAETLSAEQWQVFETQLEKALARRPDSPDHLGMMASLRRQAVCRRRALLPAAVGLVSQ